MRPLHTDNEWKIVQTTLHQIWLWLSLQSCYRTIHPHIPAGRPPDRPVCLPAAPVSWSSHSYPGGATVEQRNAGTSVASPSAPRAPWSATSPPGSAGTGRGFCAHCSSEAAQQPQSSAAGCDWPSSGQGYTGGLHAGAGSVRCCPPALGGHQTPYCAQKLTKYQWL